MTDTWRPTSLTGAPDGRFGHSFIWTGDRLIVWGGEVPPDLDLGDARVKERLNTLRLTLVYGTGDQFFTPKIVAVTTARLKTSGIAYEQVQFDGGHEIHDATLRRWT